MMKLSRARLTEILRHRLSILGAVVAILVATGLGGLFLWHHPVSFLELRMTGPGDRKEATGERGAVSPSDTIATSQASGLDAPSVPPVPDQCNFATVRIDPTGHAVIAGHAEPSALVTIRDGSHPIGQASADALGDWLVLTSEFLVPGLHVLSLEARRGDEQVHNALQRVVLDVLIGDDLHAVALMVPKEGFGASTVLQALDAPAVAEGADRRTVAIDLIDYSPSGIIALGGRAVPGAGVVVSIAGRVVASVEASPQGRWHVDVQNRLPRAHQIVRAERRGEHAEIIAFDEKSFDEGAGVDALLGSDSDRDGVVAITGDGFTRFVRRVGGGGIQVSLVYQRQLIGIEPDHLHSGSEVSKDAETVGFRPGARIISPTP